MEEKKKLKFNFMIVNRNIDQKFIKYLSKFGFKEYFLFYGTGSASSAILDYLGIGETENTILVIPASEKASLKLFEIIKNSEYLKDVIAFKVPIKGISSKKSLDYLLKEVGSYE